MTVRNLEATLHPRSVAVIGAADPILRNIIAGGFEGPVWPVDPDRDSPREPARLLSIAGQPDEVKKWCFHGFTPAIGFKAALAVQCPRCNVVFWRYPDAGGLETPPEK